MGWFGGIAANPNFQGHNRAIIRRRVLSQLSELDSKGSRGGASPIYQHGIRALVFLLVGKGKPQYIVQGVSGGPDSDADGAGYFEAHAVRDVQLNVRLNSDVARKGASLWVCVVAWYAYMLGKWFRSE